MPFLQSHGAMAMRSLQRPTFSLRASVSAVRRAPSAGALFRHHQLIPVSMDCSPMSLPFRKIRPSGRPNSSFPVILNSTTFPETRSDIHFLLSTCQGCRSSGASIPSTRSLTSPWLAVETVRMSPSWTAITFAACFSTKGRSQTDTIAKDNTKLDYRSLQ